MPMMRCEKHGLQFAGHFCGHLAEAVEHSRPSTVFVTKGPLAWHVVCPLCLSEDAVAAADQLVCEACVSEWLAATGNSSYASWREKERDEPVEAGPFSPET